MVFKNVFINSGFGYDVKFGIFMIFVIGIYVFFFFIYIFENECLFIFLMLNGKLVSKIYVGRI